MLTSSSSPVGNSSSGAGGNAKAGTAGGAIGGITASGASATGAGLGVFNVNFFCSPYKLIPSSFSFNLFNSLANKFSLLSA